MNENEALNEPHTATKSRRGFGGMDRERVREISSSGGRAAHAKGTAHKWTPEEASAAGKKGGVAPHVRRGRGRKAVAK